MIHYLARLTCAVLLLAGCVSQTYQSQDQVLVNQSIEALQQNDWDRTEAVANVALEINPDNAQAAYVLALVHEHHGRSADAKRMYQRIIKLDTQDTIPEGLDQSGDSLKLAEIARQKLGLPKKTTDTQSQRGPTPDDTDGDGTLNAQDLCADTPTGVNVDETGCWTMQGLFDSGKSEIQAKAFPQLDDVAHLLSNNPQMRIEIQGHTDSRGTYRHNLRLSRVRAQAVKQYLMSQGIAAKRLTATGYGPNRPRGTNSTSAGRAMNRRIEFRVLDK